MSKVKLSEFMRTIRTELEAAQAEMNARKQLPLFQLQEMELEMQVAMGETTTKEGGSTLWVVTGKVAKSDESEVVQTVRLTYKLASAEKGASRIGDRFHSSNSQTQEEPVVEMLPKATP